MLSGILATEEKDYNTGYSYFYEAIQLYLKLNDSSSALKTLLYMMLCKIMGNHYDEVIAILHTAYGVKLKGNETEAMKKIAQANMDKSLIDFNRCLVNYRSVIDGDLLIKRKMHGLYETLVEENIMKIVGSFSRVEITHVAELLGLSEQEILAKLSEMILDKKLNATLD